jgi:hypothetical protein
MDKTRSERSVPLDSSVTEARSSSSPGAPAASMRLPSSVFSARVQQSSPQTSQRRAALVKELDAGDRDGKHILPSRVRAVRVSVGAAMNRLTYFRM